MIGFDPSGYIVSEGTTVQVCASILGEVVLQRDVVVDVSTGDGTATG